MEIKMAYIDKKQMSVKKESIAREVLQWAVTIIGALAIAMFIRSYAFAVTEVRQSSMQDTLVEGQKLIEYKAGYSSPARGDVIVFNLNGKGNGMLEKYVSEWKGLFETLKGVQNQDHLIKRVIGLPGDTVDIKDGAVYVNDTRLEESYVKGITLPKTVKLPLKVPEGKIFVLGDNREVSNDSRYFGAINISKVEGKAIFRRWPVNEAGKLE